MANFYLSPIGNGAQFFTNGGLPLNGGYLNTYAAGTSTPLATYTTPAGNVANPTSIQLNSAGRLPNEVWFTQGQSYKFTLTDSLSNLIATYDNLTGINDPTANTINSQWLPNTLTPTYVSATQFTLVGNQTGDFEIDRRVKCVVSAGTVYGYISASVFSSVTTVTVVLDSGALDSGLSNVSLGILTATKVSYPNTIATKTYVSSAISAITGRLISETFYGIASGTVTMTIASPCVVTATLSNVSLMVGMPIVFTTSGALPTGITSGTTYYISSIATNGNFNISATLGGSNINTSGGQSGTHTASNPTYNKATNNPSYVEIEFQGAGGGSGGVAATAGATGAGGGAGAYVKFYGPASSIISGAVTLTVGAGGTGGASGGGTGGVGGSTTATIFTGSLSLTAPGGQGGSFGGASTPISGANGGKPSYPAGIAGSFLGLAGGDGGWTISTASAATSYPGRGADSFFGKGRGSTGGGSTQGGQPAYQDDAGLYKISPGASGSGAMGATANAGAAGSAGLIIIKEYS